MKIILTCLLLVALLGQLTSALFISDQQFAFLQLFTAKFAALGIGSFAVGAGLSAGQAAGSGGRVRGQIRFRGKREVREDQDVSQVLERTFLDMNEVNGIGCFQRMFCVMAADPANYQENLPLLTAAKASAMLKFANDATTEIVAGLNKAAAYGEFMAPYDSEAKATLCEAIYNQCT